MRSFFASGSQGVRDVWRAPATRWVLLASVAACGLGWATSLRPSAPVWGPVGVWVGGLATAIGLVLTAIELRAASQQREVESERTRRAEDERREAQARAVAVSSIADQRGKNKWYIKYKIMNGGDYPIDNAVLVVADPGADEVDLADQRGAAMELVLGTVLPKELIEDEVLVRFTEEPFFVELSSLALILFTDTWDQSWARGPGRLERRDYPARTC